MKELKKILKDAKSDFKSDFEIIKVSSQLHIYNLCIN